MRLVTWQLCEHKEAQKDMHAEAISASRVDQGKRKATLNRSEDDEDEVYRKRHAKFQKKVDTVNAKKGGHAGNQTIVRPGLSSIQPPLFRVSRTTGRLSHSKPKHSMDRIPTRTQSRRSHRVLPDCTKSGTGLEADSVLTRVWSRLSRKSSATSTTPILPKHSQHRAEGARRLTAREFESRQAQTGFTTEDVTESPFEERGGVPVEAEHPPAYTTDEETDSADEEEDAYYASKQIINALTHSFRVAIRRQQLSLFLTKDGTLISIFSKDGSEITPSLIARLRSKGTLLRNSEDASMLLQGIIDACADRALDIMDAFRKKLDLVSPCTTTLFTVRKLKNVAARGYDAGVATCSNSQASARHVTAAIADERRNCAFSEVHSLQTG